MAVKVLKDVRLEITPGGGAATVFAGRVKSVSLPLSVALQDKTTMGDDAKRREAGIKDSSLSVEFLADEAAGNVNAVLWAVYNATARSAFKIRGESGAISTANPEYSGNIWLETYDPDAGAVGDMHMVSASFQGDGDVTRATS